ncbi:MAG TPA: enoyl-CoA hydratase/isomerase family protein [Myxococcota bacterium]
MRVACAIEAGVATLRLDDGKVNAIDAEWCAELGAALDRIEGDAGAAAVALFGRPGCFSAGLDRKRLPTLSAPELRATTRAFVAAMERVFLFPKPVVAASAGHALAGGLMLLLAGDLRIALDDAASRYGLPEVTQGIPLIGPTAAICAAGIPPAHHAELILHGRRLSAREAFERGLLHELVSGADALESRALERARELRGLDPAAYRATKRALRAPVLEAARAAASTLAGDLPKGNPFR